MFVFLVCMYVYQRECIVTLRNQSVLLKLSLTSGSVSRISMDVDHVCESVLTVRNQPILPAKSDFWFCFQDQHGRGSWNSVAEGGDKAARNSRSVWGILVFATSDFVFCLEMSSSTLQDSYLSCFTAEYFWGNKMYYTKCSVGKCKGAVEMKNILAFHLQFQLWTQMDENNKF